MLIAPKQLKLQTSNVAAGQSLGTCAAHFKLDKVTEIRLIYYSVNFCLA